MDSMATVNIIKIEKIFSSMRLPLVKRIMKLLENDWVIEISHCYRKTNGCANILANLKCNLEFTLIIFQDCPPKSREVLDCDIIGTTTSRLILQRYLIAIGRLTVVCGYYCDIIGITTSRLISVQFFLGFCSPL